VHNDVDCVGILHVLIIRDGASVLLRVLYDACQLPLKTFSLINPSFGEEDVGDECTQQLFPVTLRTPRVRVCGRKEASSSNLTS